MWRWRPRRRSKRRKKSFGSSLEIVTVIWSILLTLSSSWNPPAIPSPLIFLWLTKVSVPSPLLLPLKLPNWPPLILLGIEFTALPAVSSISSTSLRTFWGCLNESMFLEAAARYFQAKEVHDLLLVSSSSSSCSDKNFLSNFPLLQHQWQIDESFKAQLSQRSRERLMDWGLVIRFYANALCVCLYIYWLPWAILLWSTRTSFLVLI